MHQSDIQELVNRMDLLVHVAVVVIRCSLYNDDELSVTY